MKVLFIFLLCGFALQGGSATVEDSKAVASLGENPWILHLRIAVSTNGFLSYCSGSLISPVWALTAADCVIDVRYIWVSYGFAKVINPSLVTETAAIRRHVDNKVALIFIYWHVRTTANIAPVSLTSEDTVPNTSTLCAFGGNDDNGPGEVLQCFEVPLESVGGELIGSTDSDGVSQSDIGAPLVSNGVQIGILLNISEDNPTKLIFAPTAGYSEWITQETGVEIGL